MLIFNPFSSERVSMLNKIEDFLLLYLKIYQALN